MNTRRYSRTINVLHVHAEERIVFESDSSELPKGSLKYPVFAKGGFSAESVVSLKGELPSLLEELLAYLSSVEERIRRVGSGGGHQTWQSRKIHPVGG